MPYLLDRPGLGHHVQGEVYQVDDDMLALLGTIHILRKHMLGREGFKNGNFCLFSVLKTGLSIFGVGVQKASGCHYVIYEWSLLDEIEDVPRYYKRKLESVRIIGDFMSPSPTTGLDSITKVLDLKIRSFTSITYAGANAGLII